LPQATSEMTVSELQAAGMVGIYECV